MSNINSYIGLHNHFISSFLDGFIKPEEGVKRAKELGWTHMAITDHNSVIGVPEFQKACKDEGIIPILGAEIYTTRDTGILSMPAPDRLEWARKQAAAVGVEIPDEIVEIGKSGKEKRRPPKKSEIADLIAPFEYPTKQYHLILLAMNQTGWQNLINLQSEAAAVCTYDGNFVTDDAMLAKYADGLVCTSACIGNQAAQYIFKEKNPQKALEQILAWKQIYGENFYLEIQPLNIPEQWGVNRQYMKWSVQYNIPLVATNDSHYTLESDVDDHDTLLCIGIGKFKDEPNRMKYDPVFWLRSEEEMKTAFTLQMNSQIEAGLLNGFTEQGQECSEADSYLEACLEAMANTMKIATQVEPVTIGSPTPLFPVVAVPEGTTPESYLNFLSFQGLYKYLSEHPGKDRGEYERRLSYELDIINRKGFAPYLLTVEEYIRWANNNNCPTGPGRGSAAGALTLLALGITKYVDPLEHNLLFERFLTEDRKDPPDIDSDFDYDHRESVVTHLEEKYGKEHVSHIGNIGTMKIKGALKDVGRVLRMDFAMMNDISKKMDEFIDMTEMPPEAQFKHIDAFEHGNEQEQKLWVEFHALELANPELFRLARRYEGIPRQMGIHASGILVTPTPIAGLVPTRTKDGVAVTLWSGVQLEKLNLIKFDILGLKTISVIRHTLEAINPDATLDTLAKEIDCNDPAMFQMLRNRQTDGVFQLESGLFKGLMTEIQPDRWSDITVANALGRPGPLSCGLHTQYAECKRGERDVVEPLPGTLHTVEDTFGVIAYQEQMMEISKIIAGFNGTQADSIVRKTIAKKKRDMMEMMRQCIIFGKKNCQAPEGLEGIDHPYYDPEAKYGPEIEGALARGYDKHAVDKFLKDLEGYASYCFNKSHACCYALIGIYTAWLKHYFPVEYMAALLSSEKEDEKISRYVSIAEEMGIQVAAPDINLSMESFTPMPKENKILYGMKAVKGLGAKSLPGIMEARPFTSLADALERLPKKVFDKTVGRRLIQAGAFDFENPNRVAMLNQFAALRKDKDDPIPESEWNDDTCILYERESLGLPLTVKPWWDTISEGESIMGTMEILSVNEKYDKNKNLMAMIDGVINKCRIRCICFSSVYSKSCGMLDPKCNATAMVGGKKDDKGMLKITTVKNSLAEQQKKKPIKIGKMPIGIAMYKI